MNKKMHKKKTRTDKSKRSSFPEEEREHPWLELLLDAYHIIDRGITGAIAAEVKKGKKLACARGCATCCRTHKDIPVFPLELNGIIWYAVEKAQGPEREVLQAQLSAFRKDSGCPFLIDEACSIHVVRPMACRQFNVFERPCEEGEDPFHTRRQDVLDPVKKHVDQAFFLMLPFYGIESEKERREAVETGAFHRMAREFHGCNWPQLAQKMKEHDHRKTEQPDPG
jgi:Fe-S-cluster containining protein